MAQRRGRGGSNVHTLDSNRAQSQTYTLPPAAASPFSLLGNYGPMASASHPTHPVSSYPPHAGTQDVSELQRRNAEQEQRIVVLERSLEALVGNYREMQDELKRLREGQQKNSERIDTASKQAKKAVDGNKKLEERVGTMDDKVNTAYRNSTADDDAREFMYEARYMEGDDAPMTNEELHRASDKVQSKRSDRRAGAGPRRP